MARSRPTPEPHGPNMTPAERAELDERLDRMITPPHRSDMGGGFFLLWTQRDDNDSAQVMIWRPETDAEVRGANLFYDAAHGLGAFAKPVGAGKPVRRSAEETALINAILADRADETGYLVYADYLTESGNTQGDFIRLCVELEHLKPGDPGHDEKTARQAELLEAHADEWYAPLGELGPRPEIYGHFSPWMWLSLARGVIDEVVIDRPGLLPGHATRLFAAAPFLRKLEFKQGTVDPGLARVKQLRQIEELELSNTELGAGDLTKILRSKHLTGLRTLLLNGNAIGDAGARALAAWPGLERLETLDVSSCDLGGDGLAALLGSPLCANLKTLRLGRNEGDALHAVTAFPHLRRLEALDLSATLAYQETVSRIGGAAFANTLTRLDLGDATFEAGAFEALARTALPALRALTLNNVDLSGPNADRLTAAPFLGQLEELHLDNCRLGAGAVRLIERGTFPRLRTLDLSRNRLQTAGAAALARHAKKFPALEVLKLWDNRLGADAVAALAASPLCARLTELDLNGNKIGPAGATALARSRGLKSLTSLTADEVSAGKSGRKALLDRFGESVVSWR